MNSSKKRNNLIDLSNLGLNIDGKAEKNKSGIDLNVENKCQNRNKKLVQKNGNNFHKI